MSAANLKHTQESLGATACELSWVNIQQTEALGMVCFV